MLRREETGTRRWSAVRAERSPSPEQQAAGKLRDVGPTWRAPKSRRGTTLGVSRAASEPWEGQDLSPRGKPRECCRNIEDRVRPRWLHDCTGHSIPQRRCLPALQNPGQVVKWCLAFGQKLLVIYRVEKCGWTRDIRPHTACYERGQWQRQYFIRELAI